MRISRFITFASTLLLILFSSNVEAQQNGSSMKIQVSDGTHTITYQLNETSAAKSLYNMLPLSVDVQNYGSNETIFYPPTIINYGSDCTEGDCPAGTLALFSPWGNVVMYYGAASRYSGLYILGKAIEGADQISSLSGTISVTKVETSAIHAVNSNKETESTYFSLNGTRTSSPAKGI